MNKARRLANRALDFEDFDDEHLESSDYELLLSASGAIEKTINLNSSYNQVFVVPAGSSFVWKARVKRHEIGFAVREIRENEPAIEIEPLSKYRYDMLIQGMFTVI